MGNLLRLDNRLRITPQVIRQTVRITLQLYLCCMSGLKPGMIMWLIWSCSRQGDVTAGSPLNVVSYNQGGQNAESQQAFRIYYQTTLGNIKEAVSNGLTSWQSAL